MDLTVVAVISTARSPRPPHLSVDLILPELAPDAANARYFKDVLDEPASAISVIYSLLCWRKFDRVGISLLSCVSRNQVCVTQDFKLLMSLLSQPSSWLAPARFRLKHMMLSLKAIGVEENRTC
eukprot:767841-Hanusia_phi.AAC.2